MSSPFEPATTATTTALQLAALTSASRASLHTDRIPDALKTIPQWVCWRYSVRSNGTVTKPPFQGNGRSAKTSDPATWTTFDNVLAAFNRNPTFAGIGLCLSADNRLVFIDVDDYGATPDKLASLMLTWFSGTYAETSPSGGHARHVFCFGTLPGKAGTKVGMFEAYTFPSNRYLTVTGQRIDGHPAMVTDQQAGLDMFYRYCLCKEPLPTLPMAQDSDEDGYGEPPPDDCLSMRCPACGAAAEYPDCERCGYDLTQPPPSDPNPTDTERDDPPPSPSPVSVGYDPALRLDLALKNSEIAALYRGDTGKYGDRSNAEQALVLRLLTFADGDTAVVRAWMDASGCGKWQERGKDTDVYRRNTLAAALRLWDGKPFEDKRQPDIDHGRMLAEALLRGRDKRDTAGHSDRTQAGHEQPDTGQPEMSGSEQPVKKPLFMDAADLLLTLQPPQWLIKRFVSADSLTTLFGSPGCGKSFVAIDMACCIASGQDWNGNRTATGQVLYIAGEGHVGFARRLTAWQGVHGIIPPNRLFVSTRSIAFNADGLQAVLDAIAELSDVPVLIVIDTLATVIDGNENDAADMARFIRALKAMQVRTQAAVLVVHHTGHGSKERARGHSSLNGAIDTELRIERNDGNGTLTCTKQKDSEPPQPVGFELLQSIIGEDEDGDAITSCTVNYGVADASDSARRKPSASQVIALRALHTALVAEGGTFAGQFAVHIEDWRKAAYDGGIADTPDAKQKAFVRSRKDLVAIGEVKCNEDLYWFADIGKQASAALLNSEKRKQNAANADY